MADKKAPEGRSGTKRTVKKTKEDKEKIKEIAAVKKAEMQRKKQIHDEIWSVIIIAFGVFLVISLQTDVAGVSGQIIKEVLSGLFGLMVYVLPYYLILYGILNFAQKTSYITSRSVVCMVLFYFLMATINAARYPQLGTELNWNEDISAIYGMGSSYGGVVGVVIATYLNKFCGKVGLFIVCIAAMIILIMFIIDSPISVFFDNIKIKAKAKKEAIEEHMSEKQRQMDIDDAVLAREAARMEEEAARKRAEEAHRKAAEEERKKKEPEAEKAALAAPEEQKQLPVPEEVIQAEAEASIEQPPYTECEPAAGERVFTPEDIGLVSKQAENRQKILSYVTDDNLFGDRTVKHGYGLEGRTEQSSIPVSSEPEKKTDKERSSGKNQKEAVREDNSELYILPPVSLLNQPKAAAAGSGSSLKEQARRLEKTLSSFGVNARVIDVTRGPAVTRFEVQPAPGVKVSSITKLHDDLALNLKAESLRIEAPIPGKAAIGIEIANTVKDAVYIREIIDSPRFRDSKSKISMGLGKDIEGNPVVGNLKDMPHLLIAGTTGSGKSVCLNGIIMSILYKASPDEVKFIMVDPKMVELSMYNSIPHMIVPVVSEAPKASAALGWAVMEMDNRYKAFLQEGARDLESYNEIVSMNGEADRKMPQIVIIIDEMADLMAVAKNQIENYISRLAAKARAAGMHLILATQRPSVNVITGVIKANIPSRIALAVSSHIDSQTIIDMGGAETLLGKGDMLYLPQDKNKPIRVQGCFVSDSEINAVIDFVSKNSGSEGFDDEVMDVLNKTEQSSAAGDTPSEDTDEMLPEVIEYVVTNQSCSISTLQRKFRLGFNRAARIVDMMEERGIVGPADGSRPRKVIMTAEQFEQLQQAAAGFEDGDI